MNTLSTPKEEKEMSQVYGHNTADTDRVVQLLSEDSVDEKALDEAMERFDVHPDGGIIADAQKLIPEMYAERVGVKVVPRSFNNYSVVNENLVGKLNPEDHGLSRHYKYVWVHEGESFVLYMKMKNSNQ